MQLIGANPERVLSEDDMATDFWSLLKDIEADSGTLPLVHTTDVAYFKAIREKGRLEPTARPDYNNEQLLFLFYGRPSYRVNSTISTLEAKAFAPICIIANHNLLEKSWRITPFDTGAFKRGIFTPPMHPSMTVEQFELEVDPKSPMKIIKLFFGSERSYFNAAPLPNVPIDRYENLPADSYDRLIRHQSNTDLDDRVSAIEIQLRESIDLFNNVRAIILPRDYLDQPQVIDQIQSWSNPDIILYDLPQSYIPKELMGTIRQLVRDYYVQKGYLT
jgi:hypothetical protein